LIPFLPRSDRQELAAAPANVRLPTVLGQGAATYPRFREFAALLLWTFALFMALALASFAGDPLPVEPPLAPMEGANWVGPVGEAAAQVIVGLLGLVAWVVPLEGILLGIPFVRGKKSLATPARLAGDLLIIILTAALVQVAAPGKLAFGHYGASGQVGELFGELARSLFSTAGSFLVGFASLGMILIGRASFSFIALIHRLERMGKRGAWGTASASRHVADAWRTARQLERDHGEQVRLGRLPAIHTRRSDEALVAVIPPEGSDDAGDAVLANADEADDAEEDRGPIVTPAPSPALKPKRAPRAARATATAAASATPAVAAAETKTDDVSGEAKPARGRGSRKRALPEPEPELEEEDEEETEEHEEPDETEASEEEEVDEEPEPAPAPKARRGAAAAGGRVPVIPHIIDTSAALAKEEIIDPPGPRLEVKPTGPAAAVAAKKDRVIPAMGQGFRLPSIDFLVPAKIDPTLIVDKEALFKNAELLVKTLGDYGVSGKVEDILPGPTVTTFEVSPAAGTKVSKVASLADDLALALAKKVRIVAPIPGKNRIGFELPNERRVPVNLRDLVDDRRFQELDVPLPVVLGRDILGNPVYADLSSMPHVIVAGATGAGKSVGLNVMLTSLLYRRTPEELRLLMIDPKVVELAPFDRIPHMLLPVVTDMKQAALALKWAVDEMERRYQLFADAGTKNLGTYNGWVERVIRGEARNPNKKKVIGKDHNGLPDSIDPELGSDEGEAPLPEKLPSIVLVVDEFADLMMQQGKDVEAAVARLAQKARAAGMHVILATQRPSVDVITGMIKANFPTRIAFRVAQKVDSRTILDEQGAEHLLGRGDMLIKLNGTNETKRVQCPWVSEEEVQTVTDFLRLQGEPVYDENILKPRDDEDGGGDDEGGEQDAMYDDAVRVVADTRRCSTSWLQRKLGLGYNRAARIVEMMEKRGIVGGANGSKDREVLISSL
jgi:S-DNA-T family DNA segregation ATPase FtsK/SpoIIIE